MSEVGDFLKRFEIIFKSLINFFGAPMGSRLVCGISLGLYVFCAGWFFLTIIRMMLH